MNLVLTISPSRAGSAASKEERLSPEHLEEEGELTAEPGVDRLPLQGGVCGQQRREALT